MNHKRIKSEAKRQSRYAKKHPYEHLTIDQLDEKLQDKEMQLVELKKKVVKDGDL